MSLQILARKLASVPAWSRLAPQGGAVYKPSTPADESGVFQRAGRRLVNRRSLVVSLLALCLCAAVDWFGAGSRRLYVDEDSLATRQQGTVWQHFGIRGHEVVPEIISRDEARFVFPISLSTPHLLLFSAHPEGVAEYKIILRNGEKSRQIAGRRITSAVSEKISLPSGTGQLQFIVHGHIAWFDPLLVRKFFLWPLYLGVFVALTLALRNHPGPSVIRGSFDNWLVLVASTIICLGLIEFVLQRLALKLPAAVLSAREDLGLIAPDPRWIDSPRYKQRLRPNLDTVCEWKFGDIVRMGLVPRELADGENHRYPFQTDAVGFRNPSVRAKIDVAALGDSFTDGMTLPVEEAWPARLEQITGKKVQNYGTSNYGPQQELYVLEDFAVQHAPREVVLAFFAGNDLFDAERFDRWEHAGDKPGEELTGRRLKKQFRRYETLYLSTIAAVVMPGGASEISRAAEHQQPGPRFDRGMYDIPTRNGGMLRFAVMPPYLQKLGKSRQEFERSRGWELTRATLWRMKETCDRNQSRLSVMFIPSKAEVYWPLIERALAPEELQRAIDFSCSYNHMPLRAAEIQANRLAQNDLFRAFCAEAKIPFLDLTPVLEQNAAAGRAVYYADDAHWNAAGHEVAAQELAKFLAQP